MKNLKSNIIIKKILISLILVIMLGNLVMPNYVQADVGGTLARPIFQFVAWLGDCALSFMQDVFIGENELKENGQEYEIKYSPGIIFSGDVLAFEVNFINPNKEKIQVYNEKAVDDFEQYFDYNADDDDYKIEEQAVELLNKYGYNGPDSEWLENNIQNNKGKSSADYKSLSYIVEGETKTYNELIENILEKIKNKSYSKEPKTTLTVPNNNAINNTDKFRKILSYEPEGEAKTYTLYAFAFAGDVIDEIVITVNDATTGQTIFNGQSITTVEPNRTNQIRERLTSELANKMTLDEEQISSTVDFGDSYYKTLRDNGKFNYEWLKNAATNKIEWTASNGTKYRIEFESDGQPGIVECTGKTITSTAAELQTTIAEWYNGLRIFALVGLLSVLVYIGIRIIISSAADDKAKYKKMIMNWVAAVCIVFVLHYIMVFILNISGSIRDSFVITTEDGVDTIMSNIRNATKDPETDDLDEIAGSTILYVALVIFTGVFSIQYIKRVIYMAFLTMIAPLIALTYPIDKIKDGKAQAFSMWLKEYIFNALLQPIHLLLYYILIGTAESFAISNPLYAVVAVGFLVPAEKFFRKMFGMESQTSVGTIGAAAGGAMVMSMLSKLKGKPPKEEGEKQQKVRTADQNGGSGSSGGTSRTGNSGNSGNAGTNGTNSRAANNNVANDFAAGGSRANGGNNHTTSNVGENSSTARNTITGNNRAGAREGSSEGAQVKVPSKSQKFWRGVGAVSGHIGDKYIYGKEGRKRLRKTITGAAGGLAGATIGVAAGVASGDAGKALQYAGAGAAAGYVGAANLGENVWSGAKGIGSTFKEGYMGTEAYNNAQFDKQFKKSDEYKMIAQDPQIEDFCRRNHMSTEEAVQGFLSQGVTDGTQMRKLLQKGIDADTYKGYADNNMKDPDKIRQLKAANVSAADYGEYVKNAHIRDVDKICDLKENNIDAATYDAFERMGISNINTIKEFGGDIGKAKEIKELANQFKNSDLSQVDENGVPLEIGKRINSINDKKDDADKDKIKEEELDNYKKEVWKKMQNFM